MCQPILHASYAITTHDADSYANGPFARAVLIPIREFSFGAHYLAQMDDIPRTIAEHVSLLFGVHYEMLEWEAYDESGTRRRHVAPALLFSDPEQWQEHERRGRERKPSI